MPTMMLKNVTLAFTNCMTKESPFGGFSYSFIINKADFCKAVRETLETQKTQVWASSKNTDAFILSKCNAKSKDNVTHEEVASMMGDDDVLVQVKSKAAPIANNKGLELGRGTTANILIDVFEYSYNKRDFICIRSHSDRGCTVQIVNLKEYTGGTKYFEVEAPAPAVNMEALNEEVVF